MSRTDKMNTKERKSTSGLWKNTMVANICALAILVPGLAVCASIPNYLWTGELESGCVEKGQVSSGDLWEYLGKKGDRIVIAVKVEPGSTPPDIFLFLPGTEKCVAWSTPDHDRSYLVLDYTFETKGAYAVLVRPGNASQGLDYTLCLDKIPADGTYDIDPDAPDGKIIRTSSTVPEKYLFNGLPLMIGPLLPLPRVVISSCYMIGSGIGWAVDHLNLPGKLLYDDIVSNTIPDRSEPVRTAKTGR